MTPKQLASKTFTCARCGQTFGKTRTDDECREEMESHFGFVPDEDIAIICDDCFQAIHPSKFPDLVEEYKSRTGQFSSIQAKTPTELFQ